MLVLIREPNLPPHMWAIVRKVQVLLGVDNKVRLVRIKTSTGTFIRIITELCSLPCYGNNSSPSWWSKLPFKNKGLKRTSSFPCWSVYEKKSRPLTCKQYALFSRTLFTRSPPCHSLFRLGWVINKHCFGHWRSKRGELSVKKMRYFVLWCSVD